MRLSNLRFSVLALSILSVASASAQQLISAKSGLIHYTEGDVKIGGQPAGPNNAVFQSVANGKDLVTGEGRAEMLLGPGQFVRLNENTTLRMVSNKLEATRIDLIAGSILVEIIDIDKSAPITIGFGVDTVELRKAGLYRLDAAESRLRVLEGEAIVHGGDGQNLTARKSKEVSLGAVLAESGFDSTTGDEFTRWASRRAGYVATANVSGARDVFMSGQNWSANNWAFNPWYGMYTYVPSRRMLYSPFGFNYFTPDMAFNGMFWDYLGGGYGFYGMGFGPGYGFPNYGNGYFGGYGSGYGYGYNPYAGYGGYTGGSGGGSASTGGGSRITQPRTTPGIPVSPHRGAGVGVGSIRNPGIGGFDNNGGSMARGGGGSDNTGMTRGGGGYSSPASNGHFGGNSGGGGHSGSSSSGGGFSGGGHSGGGGAVSSGGGATSSVGAVSHAK